MSALPRAVQRQLDEAEQLMAASATPPAPPAEPSPTAVETPPEPQPVVVQPVEPQPAPQPAEPPQDGAYWKARFDTMSGKYNAEIPRLTQSLQETQAALADLRSRVDAARQTPPAATPPAALVTEKDDEKFGQDLVDLMRRVSREERRPVEHALGQLEQMIRSLAPQVERSKNLEQEIGQTREGLFYSELSNAVPDWQAINADQRWREWLDEYDAVAGQRRQDSLEQAQKKFDARRVVAMFKLFQSTLPAAPAPQPKPSAALARQVTPSRSATTAVTPEGEKQFTGGEYAYWTDFRRVHDTPKETLQAMLAEVERALAEGRVKF